MQRESTSTFDFAMGLRHAALACLALLSTTRGQYINAVDDSVDSYLVAFGVADCIDAMIAINENSVDTTTIGDDATRTIEGYVSPPTDTTVTGADSILYYTATVTRDTSYAVTTLAIPEICTFQFSCSEYEAQNFSCTYDLILTEPSFNVNESFYAVATDNEDLATTWPANTTTTPLNGSYPSSAPTSGARNYNNTGGVGGTGHSQAPATSPVSYAGGNGGKGNGGSGRYNGYGNSYAPPAQTGAKSGKVQPQSTGAATDTYWPYPTCTTECPTCPTTTVTCTSTVSCPTCPGGITITLVEECLTLPTNWFDLVPISTRTVTEPCECEEQGGTTIYVVTEPCGPIYTDDSEDCTTTEDPSCTTTTEEDCPETTTEDCDAETLSPTEPCTTTTTPCTTTPVVTPTNKPVTVFKGEASRPGLTAWLLVVTAPFVFYFIGL